MAGQPQCTTDEEHQVALEASQLAENDPMAASKMIKKAVQEGRVSRSLQRQLVSWWAKGCFSLEAPAPRAPKEPSPGQIGHRITLTDGDIYEILESDIVRLMKTRKWSRKEAINFCEEGGLESEKEKNPVDDMWEKVAANGPPEWFSKMIDEKNAEGEQEGGIPGGEGAEQPSEQAASALEKLCNGADPVIEDIVATA
eukprot:CAMPEP_0204256486 /NCGR_PEP_ID=MMETSP0468-20130131/3813_1 /ASSEMBLY_ACC=CAM_ASM_000383 /TAXON_ID=2969 /ORGANISM="Oxyrrhis marina" /LENGTH=197 /DNA_ID=CAMNT_0051230453 /DNA_START=37 /DNA_END=630 /DNA_ORIENTATION=+